MKHEITITLTLRSPHPPERVEKQMESVISFGTVREAIAEALRLDEEPHLVSVVARPSGGR